jgi:hypothetical protein
MNAADPSLAPDSRRVLRHLAATLAYRAAKVLRDAPSGFGSTTFGAATRRPFRSSPIWPIS